jgi:hypothetical protein
VGRGPWKEFDAVPLQRGPDFLYSFERDPFARLLDAGDHLTAHIRALREFILANVKQRPCRAEEPSNVA